MQTYAYRECPDSLRKCSDVKESGLPGYLIPYSPKNLCPPPPQSSPQHGSNLIGMTDLNVPEQLYQYMVGGHRRTHAGINRERHKSPSYQIKVISSVIPLGLSSVIHKCCKRFDLILMCTRATAKFIFLT